MSLDGNNPMPSETFAHSINEAASLASEENYPHQHGESQGRVSEERRTFGLHPNILLTIIREQAGSIAKALAELVMNSVDAGATRIDISTDENSFSISDDGKGFTSRDQLENFFEVFGTPHDQLGASSRYGRFRIGRGQIMSYARTTWRSGQFEMRVDIAGSAADLGYDLLTHAEIAPGCRIDGLFYERNHFFVHKADESYTRDSAYDFVCLIRYVSIPVYLNGELINKLPSNEKWDHEDDFAWYRFRKDGFNTLDIYNRGIFVESKNASRFGTGGTVVTKQPLVVNMARNSLIDHQCTTWSHISNTIFEFFRVGLAKAKKLDAVERAKLLNDILFEDRLMDFSDRCTINSIKFIPDIFGELKSPNQFLTDDNYTLFDETHTMIAERAHKLGRATVIMPSLFYGTRLNVSAPDNYYFAVARLRDRLGFHGVTKWTNFPDLVEELNDTSSIVEDALLTKEQGIVLEALRYLNSRHFPRWLTGEASGRRKLLAGDSDTMNAWTDGSTYIAINRNLLYSIRYSGAARLILLMIHEYCHDTASVGNHGHDFEFFKRFHELSLTNMSGKMADALFRRYVSGICKAGIVPSSDTGSHVRQIANHAAKLRRRSNVMSSSTLK